MKDPMKPEAIVAYWGAENLIRWDHVALRDVEMPSSSKRFLSDIGLPSPERDVCGWRFEWDLRLRPFDHTDRKMRLLGTNRGSTPILIDESYDGCMIWDATKDGYERYINQSVEQFAASLIEMDKFTEDAWRTIDEPYDPAHAARRVTALRRKLQRIDQTAIADRESLWSADIFTMRLELR